MRYATRLVVAGMAIALVTLSLFAVAKQRSHANPDIAIVPPPPERQPAPDATVLFDGQDLAKWRRYDAAPSSDATPPAWRSDERTLIPDPGQGDLVTRDDYGSYLFHADVFLPAKSAEAQVYVEGRYAIQIAGSHGHTPSPTSFGAILGRHAPTSDAALDVSGSPAWQTLDIAYSHFRGIPPRVSVWVNGRQVQDDVELLEASPGADPGASEEASHAIYVHDEPLAIGRDDVTVLATFKATGDGTIFSRSPRAGVWQPNGKALFIRGGRLVYDIGWVGALPAGAGVADGEWHSVALVYRNRTAHIYVDGRVRATRDAFISDDDPSHVFKIGATSPNFGGDLEGYVDQVIYLPRAASDDEIRAFADGKDPKADDGSWHWTNPEPYDAKQPIASLKGPIRLVSHSSEVRFANITLTPLADVDHAALVENFSVNDLQAGQQIFQTICVTCHGTYDAPGSLPTSLNFWNGKFKNGSDPYSMYKTLTVGFGQMVPLSGATPKERYDVIHYLRERILKRDNPTQYFQVTNKYLNSLPKGLKRPPSAEATAAARGLTNDVYRRMDFGPSLNWTYEVAPQNFAYKGIAIRLDDTDADTSDGGISRGKAWIIYDHDTLRVAAVWKDEFVDWRGIAFDGSHGTHTKIAGPSVFVNPPAPGCANPRSPVADAYRDPRLRGRDGKPYGPLPREWAHYEGLYKHGRRVVIEYTVGDRRIFETPGMIATPQLDAYTRTIRIGPGQHPIELVIAPAGPELAIAIRGATDGIDLESREVQPQHPVRVLVASPSPTARVVTVFIARETAALLATVADHAAPPVDPLTRTHGGPRQFTETLTRRVAVNAGHKWPGAMPKNAPYVVDDLRTPHDNAWHSWMRLGGFDFLPPRAGESGGRRAAVCTWLGDVWLVDGLDGREAVTWSRIASGLFQPLGLKVRDGEIYVTCRDQIVCLSDTNGDGEIDHYRNFNNDHQVTEHFHEFAMGLETDAQGNFYYAKSARHAKSALVPQHGTLLEVSRDGSATTIVANGFRAANGVCVNPDGTFYVTDQEGHWMPKNRINHVERGGYYGNYFGYHDKSDSDDDMLEPLVWLTNAFDRSPAELLWAQSDRFGPLSHRLLQISYGMGKVFAVSEQLTAHGRQGAQTPLPLPAFPTGIMRGRFSPFDGQLYTCGMYAWAGNQQASGGFYRVRYTGEELVMPIQWQAQAGAMELEFATALDRDFIASGARFTATVWDLKRSANYGSNHLNQRQLDIAAVTLGDDDRTVRLSVPDLAPTRGMKVEYRVRSRSGRIAASELHATIHELSDAARTR